MNSQTPVCKIISTNAGHQLPSPEMIQKYVRTTEFEFLNTYQVIMHMLK